MVPVAKTLSPEVQGSGSIPWSGIRSHASVKRVHMLGLQEFTAKTWHGQTNKYFLKLKKFFF